jgi:flagellar biosynthetic protein FlhB
MPDEDRTEQPTPKRRQEARRKGQVASSKELNSALVLLCTFLFIKVLGLWISGRSLAFVQQIMWFTGQDWGSRTVYQLLNLSVVAFAEICFPIMGVALVVGCASSLAQTGFLFKTDALVPKFSRLNPLEGLKRIFSRRGLVELLKTVAKIGLAGYIAYAVIRSNLYIFPRLMDMGIPDAVTVVANLASTIVLRVGLFLLVLAVGDYIFQYTEHMKSLRMSKHEIKEEMREHEGDPQIKGRMRQRRRALIMQRMMQQVPKADVVITNPTHFAIALKYELKRDRAPVLLAKGVDEIALRIRQIAEENNIIIYEDPPLAQVLYKTVEIGHVIPESLYEAVANVLAFVYRLRPNKYIA